MSKFETFFIDEVSACAGSNADIIVGPLQVSNYKCFSVTAISCATAVVSYSIQLSPYVDEGFATAGVNWTATSTPAASGADAVVSNKILDNTHGWLRIEASATAAIAKGDVRFIVHGVRY